MRDGVQARELEWFHEPIDSDLISGFCSGGSWGVAVDASEHARRAWAEVPLKTAFLSTHLRSRASRQEAYAASAKQRCVFGALVSAFPKVGCVGLLVNSGSILFGINDSKSDT